MIKVIQPNVVHIRVFLQVVLLCYLHVAFIAVIVLQYTRELRILYAMLAVLAYFQFS
jgi:hypothetical protein